MSLRGWVALVLGLGGCAAGAGGRPATWAHATAQPDCAPWDGAATTIALSDAPLEASPEARPTLRLTIYQPLHSVGGARWMLGESKPGGAMALWCPSAGDCATIGDGWVEVNPLRDGGSLGGRYRLRLADGSLLTGQFAAEVRRIRMLCG
jgi:hypothetical protein